MCVKKNQMILANKNKMNNLIVQHYGDFGLLLVNAANTMAGQKNTEQKKSENNKMTRIVLTIKNDFLFIRKKIGSAEQSANLKASGVKCMQFIGFHSHFRVL